MIAAECRSSFDVGVDSREGLVEIFSCLGHRRRPALSQPQVKSRTLLLQCDQLIACVPCLYNRADTQRIEFQLKRPKRCITYPLCLAQGRSAARRYPELQCVADRDNRISRENMSLADA